MKYAFSDKIAEYFGSGSTVVVYNHRDRRSAGVYVQKNQTARLLPLPRRLYTGALVPAIFGTGLRGSRAE